MKENGRDHYDTYKTDDHRPGNDHILNIRKAPNCYTEYIKQIVSKSKASFRSETLVMITPTVVENTLDLKSISEDMEQEFSRVPPLKISRLNKADAVESED